MTTTCVRDSIVGDDWIARSCQAVPVQRVIGEDGMPTGDILTGPVRLSWPFLFTLPEANENNQNPKYGAMVLFTPYADFSILYEEFYKVCGEAFRDRWDGQQYAGIRSPFRRQEEKAKYGGFTPGCVFMTVSSKYKPPVVDIRQNPIVDQSKVYAGVWAICGVNAYAVTDKRNLGVSFGLQSVMIIGDDTRLEGAGADPKQQFKAVQGITAPIVSPHVAQGMPTGAPPMPAGIPGYTTPGVPTGGPINPPQILQHHYSPQIPQPQPQPQMPGAPSQDDDTSFMYE